MSETIVSDFDNSFIARGPFPDHSTIPQPAGKGGIAAARFAGVPGQDRPKAAIPGKAPVAALLQPQTLARKRVRGTGAGGRITATGERRDIEDGSRHVFGDCVLFSCHAGRR